MSQTAQSKPASRGGPGGRGGQKVYGGGKPGGQARRPRREEEVEVWIPKTIL